MRATEEDNEMDFKDLGMVLPLLAGLATAPGVAAAASSHRCVAGQPTAASYHWNFQQEASQLLDSLRQDAAQLKDHAANLEQFAMRPNLSWNAHATELTAIRGEVNDMGAKLCRLESIRRVLAPWQQDVVDRTAPELRLLADNVQAAIAFVNQRQDAFWMPAYRLYVTNLYTEANRVSGSVANYETYVKVHREDQQLQKELGVRAGA
jgi:hypothetical protein